MKDNRTNRKRIKLKLRKEYAGQGLKVNVTPGKKKGQITITLDVLGPMPGNEIEPLSMSLSPEAEAFFEQQKQIPQQLDQLLGIPGAIPPLPQ